MDCGLLLSFALCVVAAEVPWFGSQLSCFGHARAKYNSVLFGGLERCSSFVWDFPWLSLPSSQDCEGIVMLRVCSGWSSDCAGLAGCGRPGRPSGVGSAECVPLAMCKPAIDP